MQSHKPRTAILQAIPHYRRQKPHQRSHRGSRHSPIDTALLDAPGLALVRLNIGRLPPEREETMSKNMTYTDRLKIEMYLNDGKTQREIARLMNRHYNTINYEIKRGRTKLRDGQTWLEYDYYSAEIGQQKHDYHAESKGRDLKIGYWLGSTPAKQETWKFLGTIVSAATVGGVMIILNKTYGFTSGALAAPQANAMAAVIEPLMSGVGAPWLLYGIGAILAIVLTFFKIPALAFALGMFIPLELNVPLVVGGAVNWYVTSRSKDTALNTERGEKGTLLASGFIAGGALMGVVSAAMRFGGINLVNEAWLNNTWSEVLALGAYALLILYFIKASMKVK